MLVCKRSKYLNDDGTVREVQPGDLYKPRDKYNHVENLLLVLYTHEDDGEPDLVTVMPLAVGEKDNNRTLCSIAGETALVLPRELFDITAYAVPAVSLTLNKISLGEIYGEIPQDYLDNILDDFTELMFSDSPELHYTLEIMPSREKASELNPYRKNFLEYLVREQQGLN